MYSSGSVQGAISELNVYYYQCKYSELNNLFFVVLLNIENHTSFNIGIKSAYSILQLNTSTLVCFAGLRSRLLLSIVLNCELQPLSRSTIFFYPRHVRNMRVILKGVFFFLPSACAARKPYLLLLFRLVCSISPPLPWEPELVSRQSRPVVIPVLQQNIQVALGQGQGSSGSF